MIIINLSQDKSKLSDYLSNTLLDNIEKTLKINKKNILYLNKRWEFSSLICENCQYLYKCINCDIPLSIHKNPEKMICHLCAFKKDIDLKCEKCKQARLRKIWVGTQQIEDILIKYFPDAKIFRFDSDSMKNKKEKDKAIENIEKSDIIIWTKMISTWFDFEWIWLVAIILLEQELTWFKYDSEERAYINIKQVLGRAWRKWEKTEIIIQTFISDSPIVRLISEKNYKDFFLETLKERSLYNYPPFTEMVHIEYNNKDKIKAYDYIFNLYNQLLDINDWYEIIFNNLAQKKYNKYYFNIIIKWNNINDFLQKIKQIILKNKDLVISFENF